MIAIYTTVLAYKRTIILLAENEKVVRFMSDNRHEYQCLELSATTFEEALQEIKTTYSEYKVSSRLNSITTLEDISRTVTLNLNNSLDITVSSIVVVTKPHTINVTYNTEQICFSTKAIQFKTDMSRINELRNELFKYTPLNLPLEAFSKIAISIIRKMFDDYLIY